MEYLSFVGTLILVHLLGLMSPGPDFVITIRNSLTYSRATGIRTAIGVALGVLVHIFYCIAGLAFIISRSIVIFNFIKMLGATYLIYIGVKSLRARKGSIAVDAGNKKEDISPSAALKSGFLTNVLNPKATIYFLSLFTFVITPETPWPMLAIATLIMFLLTIAWFSSVAVFFTHARIRSVFSRFELAFNKMFGGLLILLGIKVAVSQR